MVKKLYIFLLMFVFIPSITVSAEIIDNDDNNTWIKNGFTLYSENDIDSQQLFMTLDYANVYYDGKYIFDRASSSQETDIVDLFLLFDEFHFYLANNNQPYGSTNYYNTVNDSYYILDFNYDDGITGGNPDVVGLLTIIVNYGEQPNNVDLVESYEFYIPDAVPPAFAIHWDFEFGTFRFYWGQELLTSNISLPSFNNFLNYDASIPAYNMTIAGFTNFLTTEPIEFFNDSEWQVNISSSPTSLFQYYDFSQDYYNSYNANVLGNTEPSENNVGGVFDAFDRLFISIGLIDGTWNYDINGDYVSYTINDTSGMLILFIILLILLMYVIRKINGSTLPMMIVAILLTSVFMFLGYMSLFVSIILIGFFIVAILTMSGGGMLYE